MGLSEYQKKRNFKKTPEPNGSSTKESKILHFVVQKHNASHLHWDFRIEVGGVMPSWAVPKGPSMNPSVKRLAMQTEDHPIDYRNFEGTIPKGEYGGGTVMIWDEGNYLPLGVKTLADAEKMVLKMLRQGEIKMVLNGKKLKGEFVLVKTERPGAENAWLLIKHTDKYANSKEIKEEDYSVKTGRTTEEISENKDATWTSKDAVELGDAEKSKMPDKISPMLATLVKESFDDPNFIFEIKWDGYRVISHLKRNEAHLFSRNELSFDKLFGPIKKSLEIFSQEMILDGEAVILDRKGKSSFQLLQNYKRTGKGNLVYYIFDILYFDGHDLRDLPLIRRKEILKTVLQGSPSNIKISEFIEEKGKDFFEIARQNGIEGIIGKDKNSPYRSGERTIEWRKLKVVKRQEVVVGGFTEPRGGRKHFGALVLGVYDDKGDLVYVGHSGGGFTAKLQEETINKLTPLVVKDSPFKELPKTNMPATWVKPRLVCEVEFTEWTEDGSMRHPVFVGFREDKNPKDVKKEIPKQVFNEPVKKDSSTEEVIVRNRDKIYWPDEGYTKGDMIDYYEKIAPYILPYLKNRPESLHRYPEGIKSNKSFWQKDMVVENLPEWTSYVTIHSDSEDKDIDYFLCQNERSLIYLANLGCIEINPWFSRVGSLENPDFMAIDLDPEEIGFEAVIETALTVREVLMEAGIDGHPKTSGATGIHIYIPLGSKYPYEVVRQFAEILAKFVHRKLPDITSVVRNPEKRQGKVYVDFLQNRIGQTLAAPYSLRPKKGATVSTPLRWEELKPGLAPQQFTIKTIFKRLEKIGDIYTPVLGKGINIEKALLNLQDKEGKRLSLN